jgi:tRNA(Ser,Leu) C12 N-acetylase TAN1
MMRAWNVVATTRSDEYPRARQLLQRFGKVDPTGYYNVLVLSVLDPRAFLDELTARARLDPRIEQCISRVAPMTRTFEFSSAADFEARAREIVLAFVPQLEGRSFHVRMTRRGFKHEMSSQAEERLLDHALLEALQSRGASGRISFDDPDAIIEVETIDGCAGMSLWTRDDLHDFPLLRVD